MKIPIKKYLTILTLFTLTGAGFSYSIPTAFGQDRFMIAQADKKAKSKKTDDKKVSKETDEEESDALFLETEKENRDYLPEIFRCPECGYEQDEEGFCPDHDKMELVKIKSKGRDPLAPMELDGNEDIVVDIPLTSLEFKKNQKPEPASGSRTIKPKGG